MKLIQTLVDFAKSTLSSISTQVILCVITGLIGFYLGWHLHNEKIQTGVLDAIQEVRDIESNAIKSSVIYSESTYNKINEEIERANHFTLEYKKHQNEDVLDARLPDDIVRLLYAASSGQAKPRSPR